ncbi:MAG: transposase [Mesorhizobium sp.]|nr:MAG: transposase [Mesorhizobium sp.]
MVRREWIGDEKLRVHLFVATLGFSRRMHIRALPRERQADWFEGMASAFLQFGGVPAEVLLDNAGRWSSIMMWRRARFGSKASRLRATPGLPPRACAPYRAGTKGKDERGVGCVKRRARRASANLVLVISPSFKQRPDTSLITRKNSSACRYSQENGLVACNCAANRRP